MEVIRLKRVAKPICSTEYRGRINKTTPQSAALGVVLTVCIQKMISIPTNIPPMVEKAGNLLWYIKMDWGRISPNTT